MDRIELLLMRRIMLDNGDGDGDDNIWVVSSETGLNMFVVVGVFLRNKRSYFCHRDKRRQILEHFKMLRSCCSGSFKPKFV